MAKSPSGLDSTAFDHRKLQRIQDSLLKTLVLFYFEIVHKNPHSANVETGGLYENKLAHRAGLENVAASEVTEACRALEAKNLVRSIQLHPEVRMKGLWPTMQGLERARYLHAGPMGKIWIQLKDKWLQVAVAAVTTMATLSVSHLFGLFGLKGP